jgi:hypothetical protein
MTDILDTTHVSQEEPKLIVRKALHAPVWSVWAVLEGIPSEEIFEGSSGRGVKLDQYRRSSVA